MRSKINTKRIKAQVNKALIKIKDDNNYDKFFKQYIYTIKCEYKYDPYPINDKNIEYSATKDLYVHIYFNENIYLEHKQSLRFNINTARELYNNEIKELKKAKNETLTAEERVSINIGAMQYFIDKYCKFNDQANLIIDTQTVDEAVKYSGVMVLLSDNVSNGKYAYFAYTQRKKIEETFQTLKSTLNFNRPYTSSDQAFNGRLLCQFNALSVMSYFDYNVKKFEQNRTHKECKIRLNSFSLSHILEELDTIMITSYKNSLYFDEIQGRYKFMYQALDVLHPKDQYCIEDSVTENDEPYEVEIENSNFVLKDIEKL